LWRHKKIFDSITPFTLLDFEDCPACIVWFSGCNLRCPYCYNPELVFGEGKFSFDEVEKFLQSRVGLLEGVVLCGGEPTIHKELKEVTQEIKELGFRIKLDTNGTYPKRLEELLPFLDFVALDLKHPIEKIEKSLDLLLKWDKEYEVRTTYHSDLISFQELKSLGEYLNSKGYKKKYAIQNFVENQTYIDPNLKSSIPLQKEQQEFLTQKIDFEIEIR
jgi:pyruvate formate lyase activating enzyme